MIVHNELNIDRIARGTLRIINDNDDIIQEEKPKRIPSDTSNDPQFLKMAYMPNNIL